MKIQCSVCETAEAKVLCCADEAALCHDCDDKVHAANKLATRHQRVSLSPTCSSNIPNCDICQDTAGYFFCIEDRALLCRKCDLAIHTANTFVSSHQRFLLTGVKVGLEPAEPGSSSSGGGSYSGEKISDTENHKTLKRSTVASTNSHDRAGSDQRGVEAIMPSKRSMSKLVAHEHPKMQPVQSGVLEDITQSRMTDAGGSFAGTFSQWPIDEFLGLNDFHLNYGIFDNGSSKADSGKVGDSDSSSIPRSIEDDLDSDYRLGQVPDVSWTVPQVPSPPTASGLHWPKTSQRLVDNAVFVPDICWSQAPSYQQ